MDGLEPCAQIALLRAQPHDLGASIRRLPGEGIRGELGAAEVRGPDVDGTGALGEPQGSGGPVGVVGLSQMCKGKGDSGARSSGNGRNRPWPIF